MTKKLFASIVCAFGFLFLGAHPASAGSVSTSVFAEADAVTNCINTGSTTAFCDVGFAQASAAVGAGQISLFGFAVSSQFLGGQSAAFVSGSINDLLTFTDGSLTGSAFVEFTFGVQNDTGCVNQSFDATAGNQAVPLSSLPDDGSIVTFATTPQAVTFGSPFSFGMSADAGCFTDGSLQLDLFLEDILVLNANGNPILGISLTSGSGTNYPLDSRNITPEPASLSLLATGILGIFAAVRRKIA
ncbi:MAG TPA: PEP-CTERM sorting domain-containing protein [Candidatus Angelobacter sp.]|nr:PEP-CTERM sorting domain-containing protein [Candidatus Angelobacter sp.]